MNVVILHGIGSAPGDHWQSWLRDELVGWGHIAITPALPNAGNPDRFAWLDATTQAVAGVGGGKTVLVGHSLGVTSALDFIETTSSPIDAIVSVAGFGADYGSELNGEFLRQRVVDFERVRSNVGSAFVFYGDDDPWVSQSALQDLADALGVTPVVKSGGGHLNTSSGYATFPELLDVFEKLEAG